MKKFLYKVIFNKNDFNELFFPIFSDFNSINREIDKKLISNDTWDLVNNETEYNKVLQAIKDSKKTKDKGEIGASFKSVILE